MTSATIKPARSGRVEREGYGLVLFASVMLLVIGCFNLIYGIAAVANAHVFIAGAHYVWGDLRFWGWATLIIGALQLLAAAGVAAGNQLARWFGVAVLGINAIAMMFFIPAYRRRCRPLRAVRLRQPRQHSGRLARARYRPRPTPWGAAASMARHPTAADRAPHPAAAIPIPAVPRHRGGERPGEPLMPAKE
jgi:hypothetical protein